jgi:hypothetical protein
LHATTSTIERLSNDKVPPPTNSRCTHPRLNIGRRYCTLTAFGTVVATVQVPPLVPVGASCLRHHLPPWSATYLFCAGNFPPSLFHLLLQQPRQILARFIIHFLRPTGPIAAVLPCVLRASHLHDLCLASTCELLAGLTLTRPASSSGCRQLYPVISSRFNQPRSVEEEEEENTQGHPAKVPGAPYC